MSSYLLGSIACAAAGVVGFICTLKETDGDVVASLKAGGVAAAGVASVLVAASKGGKALEEMTDHTTSK